MKTRNTIILSQRNAFRLMAVFVLTAISLFAADQEAGLQRKINRMERYIYGQIQEGALIERVTRIHKDLLGRDSPKGLPEKTDNLYNFLFKGTENQPSMDMKINFLEWRVFHENRRGKFSDRLEALDKLVFGKASNEPLAFRVEQLIQMSVETGIIAMHRVKLPTGTAFRVRLDRSLSSKTAKAGDEFVVSVTGDFILEKNILIVPKGGYVVGELDKVRRAGRFGRSGYLKLLVNELAGIDGTMIPVRIEGPADAIDKKKMGMAIGAATVGYVALGGPVGLVGGIFVKGKDAVISEGTEFLVSSLENVYVNGVVITRK